MQYPVYPVRPAYPAPQPQFQPRPVAVQPRPQLPRPALQRVEVPPPEKLGIRVDDAPAIVDVPPPEKLGITVD